MKYYISFISLFLISSVTSEVCYRGNMKEHPVSFNTDTPPCLYKEPDGTYSCYEYLPGTKDECPFPGYIKEKKKEHPKCYRANMKEYPVSGHHSPPCWYREPDGTNSCYEYEPNTHKCPNFPNPIKRPL